MGGQQRRGAHAICTLQPRKLHAEGRHHIQEGRHLHAVVRRRLLLPERFTRGCCLPHRNLRQRQRGEQGEPRNDKRPDAAEGTCGGRPYGKGTQRLHLSRPGKREIEHAEDDVYPRYSYQDGKYYFTCDGDFESYLLDKNINSFCEKAFLNTFVEKSQLTTYETNPNLHFFDTNLLDLYSVDKMLPRVYYENGNTKKLSDKEFGKLCDEEDQLEKIKEVMREWYEEPINYDSRTQLEVSKFSLKDFDSVVTDDYNSLVTDITLTNENLYQYKQYKKILPFEIETESIDYIKYLIKDYSEYKPDGVITSDNINYISQEEIALYEYLKQKDQSMASNYIKALEDTINSRKGYEEAALRLCNSKSDVISLLTMGAYGFGDGVENFSNGLANFFLGIDSCLGTVIIEIYICYH